MALMVIVALIIDAIAALLVFLAVGLIADTILSVGAWLMYYIWFKVRGVKFGSRSALRMGVTTVAELIPAVNALPMWTAGIIWTLSAMILEDELGVTVPVAGAGAVTKGAAFKGSVPPPLPPHIPSGGDMRSDASPSLGRRSTHTSTNDTMSEKKKPENIREVDFDEQDEGDEDEESLAA
jgi:hypothetical protein